MLSLAIGLPAGIISAVRTQHLLNRLAMIGALLGQVTPGFFLGTILVLVVGLWLRWLPTSGNATPWHLILPAITLSAYGAASMARLSAQALLEVTRKEYMRTAYAKGLRERSAILRHALRNAAIPIVTVMGIQLGHLLSGAVATEVVFAWPGVGRLAGDFDLPAGLPGRAGRGADDGRLYVLLNLTVDVLYAWIDPKIRYR